jgi:integrase
MSIIKSKSGGWKLSVRVRKDGRIVQRREVVDGSKEQAKARVEAIKYEIRHGREPASSLTSQFSQKMMSELIEFYREKSPKAPFSAHHNRTVNAFKKDLGDIPVQEFPDRFEAYLKLKKETETFQGKKRKPASTNRFIEVAKAAFEVAKSLKEITGITSNPITKERFPKGKEIPRDVDISADERIKMVEYARSHARLKHVAEAINYAMQVPIRRSEIVSMQVRDIDLFNRAVRVRNGTTKNDQGTYKPIPPDMLDFFKRRVMEKKSDDEPVFYRLLKGSRKDRTGALAKRLPLGDFKNAWTTIKTECGLPHIHIHDTRHVSATALVDAGTPERVVMQVAGWKTNMLATYYNRHPKKALGLVQFGKPEPPQCESLVNHGTGDAV